MIRAGDLTLGSRTFFINPCCGIVLKPACSRAPNVSAFSAGTSLLRRSAIEQRLRQVCIDGRRGCRLVRSLDRKISARLSTPSIRKNPGTRADASAVLETGPVIRCAVACESVPKWDPTSDRPQLLDTLKEFLFRVGPRSAPIGTPTSGVLAGDFSDLLLFWPGSRFGADSHSTDPGNAGSRLQRLCTPLHC